MIASIARGRMKPTPWMHVRGRSATLRAIRAREDVKARALWRAYRRGCFCSCSETMIAALFVQDRGCYHGLIGVDPWGIERDARNYAGPWAGVFHPPCERWGRYWSGGPSARVRRKKGDDGGCFKAALASVRRWGGVLEHPEGSHAWAAFGLARPPRSGGWVKADDRGGWTCCVAQGKYGHKAQKLTWLYAVGCKLPELDWGPCPSSVRLDAGFHTAEERRRRVKQGVIQRLSKRERAATPIPFRDLLIGMARSVKAR